MEGLSLDDEGAGIILQMAGIGGEDNDMSLYLVGRFVMDKSLRSNIMKERRDP